VFKLVSSRAKFCHRDTLFATGITVTSFRDPSPHLGRFQVFLFRLEQGGTASADPYNRLGRLSWSQFPLILDLEQCESIHITWERGTAVGYETLSKDCPSFLTCF
jgi:hypothetical protein